MGDILDYWKMWSEEEEPNEADLVTASRNPFHSRPEESLDGGLSGDRDSFSDKSHAYAATTRGNCVTIRDPNTRRQGVMVLVRRAEDNIVSRVYWDWAITRCRMRAASGALDRHVEGHGWAMRQSCKRMAQLTVRQCRLKVYKFRLCTW